MRRAQVAAALGATALIAFATPAVVGVVDRVLPHEVQPWDVTVCVTTSPGEHTLVGVTGSVPDPGDAPVTIVAVQPVGLAPGISWRSWVVPVVDGVHSATHPDGPPAGWSQRAAPGDVRVTAARPAQLFVELWSEDGDRTVTLPGALVRYRTGAGLLRTAVTPTSVSMRADGCG